MSEQQPEAFDIAAVAVEDAPEDFVVPQPDEIAPETPADAPVKESAAERVRKRLRANAGAGRAPSEPSTTRGASRPSRVIPPKPREGSLVKPLTELYTSLGIMIAPLDPVCSVAIIENAEPCARSLENLARENEAVRRAILALTQTTAWGGVIIAHLPLLLMVMTHHGPREVAERTAPLAAMMNAGAMKKAQEAQSSEDEN